MDVDSKESSVIRRPHISRFARTAMLAFFAIGLVSSVNAYIQIFEFFDEHAITSTDEA